MRLHEYLADTKAAYKVALAKGILSEDEKEDNYIGLYIYVGNTEKNEFLFKHLNNRKTIRCPKE